jgi:hypothetical protein
VSHGPGVRLCPAGAALCRGPCHRIARRLRGIASRGRDVLVYATSHAGLYAPTSSPQPPLAADTLVLPLSYDDLTVRHGLARGGKSMDHTAVSFVQKEGWGDAGEIECIQEVVRSLISRGKTAQPEEQLDRLEY